jgi:uncharacterized membrane protein
MRKRVRNNRTGIKDEYRSKAHKTKEGLLAILTITSSVTPTVAHVLPTFEPYFNYIVTIVTILVLLALLYFSLKSRGVKKSQRLKKSALKRKKR